MIKNKKPLPFHAVIKLIEKIIKICHKFTLLEFKSLSYNPLERLYLTGEIFSKEGFYAFLDYLKKMEKEGLHKKTNAPLTLKEKEKIEEQIKKLESMINKFKANPDYRSPYLRDRYMARQFKPKNE